MPGQTLLTRMDGANSAASARVRLTTPPFEAAYAVIFGVLGKRPCPDANVYDGRKGPLGEPGEAAAHHDIRAGQIDVEHEPPVRNPDIEHRPVNDDAGGVHDAVDAAHCSSALLDGSRH